MENKKRHISEFFGLLKDSEQSTEEWQEIAKSTRKSVSGSFKKRHELFDEKYGEESSE